MNPQRLLFGIFYRIGLKPWDGHRLSPVLVGAVERGEPPRGAALDVGCGTGDGAIFLAGKGYAVTGVDLVEHALRRARRKAETAGLSKNARFLRGDVTQLGQLGLGSFQLVVDTATYHGLPDKIRGDYAREVTAAAAPGAHFFLSGLPSKKRPGPKGFDRAEIERTFSGWEILAMVDDDLEFRMHGGDHLQLLQLRRKQT
jgi:2-polyprenyl-3-methyl-5-hydroxy-6-metoxy-1,4-benzoquinol methylase